MSQDPFSPMPGFPGDEERILWLQARAALRLPLFEDGPRQEDLPECLESRRDCVECGRPLPLLWTGWYCSGACRLSSLKLRRSAQERQDYARALADAFASQPSA